MYSEFLDMLGASIYQRTQWSGLPWESNSRLANQFPSVTELEGLLPFLQVIHLNQEKKLGHILADYFLKVHVLLRFWFYPKNAQIRVLCLNRGQEGHFAIRKLHMDDAVTN